MAFSSDARSLYNWDDAADVKHLFEDPPERVTVIHVTTVNNGSSDNNNNGSSLLFGPLGFSLFLSALIIAALVFCFLALWYLKRRWGIVCCRRGYFVDLDTTLTAAQQKEQEAKAVARKKQIISEVTLIVEEKHLLRNDQETATTRASDSEELDRLESGTGDDDTAEDTTMLLQIPGVRQTSAHCAICLTEYQIGDEVVWSPNGDCIHCYHKSCIMAWLDKDKKDCPCCRSPFLSLQKPDDTKEVSDTETDDESERSGHHILDEEEGNHVVSSSDDENSHHNLSSSDDVNSHHDHDIEEGAHASSLDD